MDKKMKKEMIKIILWAIGTILLVIAIDTLIFWGLGNLVIYVFHINYIWTICHGFVAGIVYIMIREIFNNSRGK